MIYFAYADGTVEEAIAATVTRRMASMEARLRTRPCLTFTDVINATAMALVTSAL